VIVYNPMDGEALKSSIPSNPRHCFLMTRLGKPIAAEVEQIRKTITDMCRSANYKVIDASSKITGRDFLLKIWKLIASTPLAVGICHEEIPPKTQANIWYELGVAQAMGKETLLVKSPHSDIPSDFLRTEYIEFNAGFSEKFAQYLESLDEQARHYELVADQLEKNPVLAIDYLKRAYLISGDASLRKKVRKLVTEAGLDSRAKNSVEAIAAAF
jgi:hypothetical protein